MTFLVEQVCRRRTELRTNVNSGKLDIDHYDIEIDKLRKWVSRKTLEIQNKLIGIKIVSKDSIPVV